MSVIILAWAAAAFAAPSTPEAPTTDCPQAVRAESLAESIGAATGAFAGLDVQAFNTQSEAVWAALPCVGDPLTTVDVADLHRLRALDAFLAQDMPTVNQSMLGAKFAAPDYRLPTAVAPKGHPLRTSYEATLEIEEEARETVPVPDGAKLLVDGKAILTRPTSRPAVVQLLQADGKVSWTDWLEPSEELPDYPALSDDYRQRYLQDAKVLRVRDRHPVELVVASAIGVGASSLMYGLSRGSRASFDDVSTADTDLRRLRARTNSLMTASVISGVAGIGLGATAAVTW